MVFAGGNCTGGEWTSLCVSVWVAVTTAVISSEEHGRLTYDTACWNRLMTQSPATDNAARVRKERGLKYS